MVGGGVDNNNNRVEVRIWVGTIERVNDRIWPTCLSMVISPVSVSRQRMTEKKIQAFFWGGGRGSRPGNCKLESWR